MTFRGALKDTFTDSLGRLEPKMILGIPLIILGVIYYIVSHPKDLQGAAFISGIGLTLVGGTAVADGVNDRVRIPKDE